MVILCLAFWGTAKLFSTVAVLFLHSHHQGMKVPVSPYPWQHLFLFIFLFFCPHRPACRILVPWQLKHRVLTTGPPGNSQNCLLQEWFLLQFFLHLVFPYIFRLQWVAKEAAFSGVLSHWLICGRYLMKTEEIGTISCGGEADLQWARPCTR